MADASPAGPATGGDGAPAETVLQRLRRSTHAAHERLEARLDVVARLCDPAGRRWLMGRFWGLHAGAERALAPVLGEMDGLDYAGRRKSAILARDLADLGVEPEGVGVQLPPMSRGEALGVLYVLEGSTLGGRVIAREMMAAGQPTTGLSFFDAYGAATGARWRAFTAVLEAEIERGRPGLQDDVVRGAITGFGVVEAWLCGETPA